MSVPPKAYNIEKPSATPFDPETAKDVLLFQPITSRSITLKNRIVVPPMCMYSAQDGFFNDFHVGHYFNFALKGAALVIIEATAVEARGRISAGDAGLWSDEHIQPLKRVADIIRSQGAVPGIQIAHSGRKANMSAPFEGYKLTPESEGGWPSDVIGPTNAPFDAKHASPRELSKEELKDLVQAWANAARRADVAGIDILEIHGAHGYLLHSFLSGNTNKRTDEYGGSLENRMRFPLEVAKAVRDVWPKHKPLWFRISSSDCKSLDPYAKDPEGWDLDQSIIFARELKKLDFDVVDCSSGGNLSSVPYTNFPLYQVPFAEAVRKEAGIATGAVGQITKAEEAESILREGKADYILVGRELLRNSNWPLDAARDLKVPARWPKQYERADKERWIAKRAEKLASKV